MKRTALQLLLCLFALSAFATDPPPDCVTTEYRDDAGNMVTLPAPFAGIAQSGYPVVLRPTIQGGTPGQTVPSAVVSRLTEAKDEWTTNCPATDPDPAHPPGSSPNIPRFQIGSGAPNDIYTPIIDVIFHAGQAPPVVDDGAQVAQWHYEDDGHGNVTQVINVYENCPVDSSGHTYGVPCDHGKIDWSKDETTIYFAHELGHALGLGHDKNTTACAATAGLMRDKNSGGDWRGGDYCERANRSNCDPSAGGGPCADGPFRMIVRADNSNPAALALPEGASTTVTAKWGPPNQEQTADVLIVALRQDYRVFEESSAPRLPKGESIRFTVASVTPNVCTVTPSTETATADVIVSVKCVCTTTLRNGPAAQNESDGACAIPPEQDPMWEYDKLHGACSYCSAFSNTAWWLATTITPVVQDCGPPVCTFVPHEPGSNCGEDPSSANCTDTLNCISPCASSWVPTTFYGPQVALDSPHFSDPQRQILQVSGWTTDRQNVQSVQFFMDRHEILLDNYERVDRPEACGPQNSPAPPDCGQDAGFIGTTNISQLNPGPHLFTVAATDADPNFPVPSIWEYPFTIAPACSDTIAPQVSLAAPAAGIIGGIVALAANASDNVSVARIEYAVDGAVVATAYASPFSKMWDTHSASAGTHVLTAVAYDGCGNRATSAPVTVDVRNNTEHSPKARNDRASTNIGIAVTIDVLANDSDQDGQPITLSSNAIRHAPAHGAAVRASNESIRYTPAAGYSGNDAFEYEIVDPTGRTDRAWVTMTVAGYNTKPVAEDDHLATDTTRAVSADVTANDHDADGDHLSLIASPFITLPVGGVVRRVSSTIVSFTPTAGFTGTDRFEYEIADGKGGRARAWVDVTVTDMNHKPVAVNDTASTLVGQSVTIVVTANDSDPDGDDVWLIGAPIVVAPAHGSASRVSADAIAYQPAPGFAGTDVFQYDIGDGRGKRARASVTVTIAQSNHAPEAVADDITTPPATPVTVNVTGNDADADGDHVILTANPILTAPQNGTALKLSADDIRYAPRAGFSGSDRFQYQIADSFGATASAWVNVTVSAGAGATNHNPTATDDIIATRPGQSVTFNVTTNDYDPDGDTIFVLATNGITVAPAHGTASRVSNTAVSYTPAAGFLGNDTFQYTIGDGRGLRARAWVHVIVTDANSPPTAVDDTALTAMGQAVTVAVLANDSDPDRDSIALIAEPIIVAPAHGTAVKASPSSITYTPAGNFSGADSFQYAVRDGRGRRGMAWVNVTVVTMTPLRSAISPNANPTAANDGAVGLNDLPIKVAVLVTDSDNDGDGIRLAEQAVVTPPVFGSAIKTENGEISYLPPFGFSGNDAFEYEIVDELGARSRAWVAVNVPDVNQAPIANDDTANVLMNRNGVLTVLKNDSDPDGDSVTLGAVGIVTPPQFGTVRRDSDEQLTYTPNPDYYGPDSLTYEITDGRGARAQAKVSLSVLNHSLRPNAVADAATVDAGTPSSIAILSNDSDPDGDPLRVVSSSQPSHGVITWESDGVVTYTPEGFYAGSDSFDYVISDPSGLESAATVSLTVRPPQRPPIVQNDSASTTTRTAVLIPVLANDYDPNYGRLAITRTTTPAHGTVVANGTASLTYQPASTFAGSDSFQYTVANAAGFTATAIVSITVTNAAPLPRTDILAGIEDQAISYGAYVLLGNDVDPDGDTLRVTLIEQPTKGSITAASDFSSFLFTPPANWSGVADFYYTVADPFGAQVRVFAQISVASVNDQPVPVNDTFSTYKNQILRITPAQVLGNDTDIEGQTLSVYGVGTAPNGIATKLTDGTIEYQPYGEFTGSDSFDYIVQDSGGAYGTGRITVNVLQDTKPVANFIATCTGRTCVFDASSSTDDRGIVTYQWTLGNNQSASGRTFTYTYAASGGYSVRLTVTDVLGQQAAVQKFVSVTEPPPDARDDSFSWKKGYAREILYSQMLANDTDPNNDALTIVSTDTTLTDGTLSCSGSSCVFTPPGPYWYGQTTFKYTVSDGHGQTDTATVTINFTF